MKKGVKILVTLACLVCAGSLFAIDNWWRGTVDGYWSTPGNWSREHAPTSSETVYFDAPAEPITIYVSGECSINDYFLYERTVTATGPSVTLKKAPGADSAKIVAATSPNHGRGRAIVFDGVTYEQTAGDYSLKAYGAVTVKGDGGFVMKASAPFFRFYDNSSFTLTSGKASFYPYGYNAQDTCTFRVTGGVYDFSSLSSSHVCLFPANAVIDFRGGKIFKTTAEGLTDPRYLPKGTAVFDNRGGNGNAAMKFGGSFEEEFSGTLYMTNRASSNTALQLSGPDATLWGRGTYFANWYYPTGANGTNELDLARFVLGQYLFGNTATIRFRRGVVFGAYSGDVSTYSGPKEIDFHDDIGFATTDAVDGATARTIRLKDGTVKLMPCASISVTGAGKAWVSAVTSAADPLEKIDVGAGSTLELGTVNAGKVPIKVAELTMGANAKIAYAVKNASIESVKKPTVGAGAGLQVSTSGMTAGTPLAVYYSTAADEDDPMPTVTFSGSAGNWQVKRLGGLLYLEDNAAYPTLTDATGWKPAPADGYWETAGNWVGGEVPASNERAVFWASSVAAITNENAVSCLGLSGGYSPAASNAQKPTTPYVFRGEKMTLSSDTASYLTGAVCWWGQTPVIFENEIVGSGANRFFVYVNKPTFAEFRDKFTVAGALNVNGDVRVAGTATAKKLVFGTTVSGRPTVLHVYNGGSLALSAQDGVMTDANSILAVSAGSAVNVAGTKLAFNSAAMRSHVVDGALTATCPYVNMGTQTFAGSGTVSFASATTAEGGAGVTYLAHGMTLKMGGDWQTAADATATSKIALDKFETATLGATESWTYGPAAGVTPTSEAESRALTLGDHSTLTVAAGNHTITLVEPIVGAKASVNLASGTLRLSDADQVLDSIAFVGGKLSATRDAVSGGWTTLVTAKKITGEPLLGSGLKGKVVANGDGTFSIQVKAAKGLVVVIY